MKTPTEQIVLDTDGTVILYRDVFDRETRDRLFQQLQNTIIWHQETITVFGRSHPLPRLTAWYGDPGATYTYSGIAMQPHAWTQELLDIRGVVNTYLRVYATVELNSVLLNYYLNGQHSVGWHSDDEPELGKNPVIASMSFGATRRFCFKHKFRPLVPPVAIDLPASSLLLMLNGTQHHWLHQVPKTRKPVSARINLTFRTIKRE